MIRRRPTRPRGRHRDGVATAPVPRYTWDHEARAEAAMLEITWPGWSVLYGTGSRLFHAIATWPTPEPLLLCDRTIEGLKTQMREAEMTALLQRWAPTSTSAGIGHF
ncbi:hypothetical protein OIE13_31685 [Streptosporangium sp. NBC_01810]|uniref:hypothetical protein n=1 Tax=Streptosporangium sp. NBC_01810 TaxID=2975951 RepID=UPI002DD80B0C|nr:hypothetical protein [Streptosporangium sp. NBC_01810]WSA25434.1 hypothetical protein OIE13_31685 [Streptosporangium sp. NBC_01810]